MPKKLESRKIEIKTKSETVIRNRNRFTNRTLSRNCQLTMPFNERALGEFRERENHLIGFSIFSPLLPPAPHPGDTLCQLAAGSPAEIFKKKLIKRN